MAVELGVAEDVVEFREAGEEGTRDLVERVEEQSVDDDAGVETEQPEAGVGAGDGKGFTQGNTNVLCTCDGCGGHAKYEGLKIAQGKEMSFTVLEEDQVSSYPGSDCRGEVENRHREEVTAMQWT